MLFSSRAPQIQTANAQSLLIARSEISVETVKLFPPFHHKNGSLLAKELNIEEKEGTKIRFKN
jgi:hypothetical protein